MTTIAWDGTTLAGDSLGDRGGLKFTVQEKVFRLPGVGLFGASGNWTDVLAVRDWLAGGDKPSSLDEFSGILIHFDGRQELIAKNMLRHPVPMIPFALGSGRDFAIAAMLCGKNARQAVELACGLDTYSGLPVTGITLAGNVMKNK